MSAREPADLLIEARWLLPIGPANMVLEHHAVAVSGGCIRALGPAAQLRARFAPREHVVRERHALLPGLVNAHTYACHTLLRALPVHGPRLRWLEEIVAPMEERAMSADFVRDGTRLAVAEMLRAGITCFADLSLFPEEAARVAAAAHMRVAIGLPVADAPTPWAESATAHLAKAERLWDEYRADSRVTLYFAPLTRGALSETTLSRVRRVADELEARIAVHLGELRGAAGLAEFRGVRDGPPEARAVYAERPLQRLETLGLLRPGFTAIGSPGGPEELELLRRHGACLISCPQADLRLGASPAALAVLPEDRCGLGTDSALAAGTLDVLAEARAAALLGGLSAPEALRMATLGGATALGLAAHSGSIEPGKAADLTCLDLGASACGAAPPAAIPDAIVFAATRGQVSDVWTGGRAALSGGRLLGFDEEELAALPRHWAQRLRVEAAA
jgi:5-methylthioadenosine/S-adenosylhomocysteine deaminase